MKAYSLRAGEPRTVVGCSRNLHVNECHPDRVMEMHDLIYIVSGEWVISQAEVEYTVRAGDVILLAAGMHHSGPKPCEGEVHTIFVHFSSSRQDGMCDSAMPSREKYSFPVVSRLPPASPVPSLLEKMVSSYWQRDVYAPERAAHYLSLVLCELSLLAAGAQANVGEAELVKRLVHAMDATPDRFYSVAELAEMIHVSPRTLHSYFRAVTGMSPRAYQIAAKLDAARQNLAAEEHVRLKDLAARYGFCDEYHFSKLYKARFGCAPKAGQKQKPPRR